MDFVVLLGWLLWQNFGTIREAEVGQGVDNIRRDRVDAYSSLPI